MKLKEFMEGKDFYVTSQGGIGCSSEKTVEEYDYMISHGDEILKTLNLIEDKDNAKDSQKATPLKIYKEDSDVVTTQRLLNKKGSLTRSEVNILLGE